MENPEEEEEGKEQQQQQPSQQNPVSDCQSIPQESAPVPLVEAAAAVTGEAAEAAK